MKVTLVITVIALCGFAVPQEIPVISQHPSGGVYSEDDPVTLTCTTETTVDSIKWYRDDELVGSSGTVFTIESFSAQNAGGYVCRATTNGVGTVTSAIAVLELAVFTASAPGEPNSPSSLSAFRNQPIILDCGELTSIPPTTYDWKFESFDIHPSQDRAIVGVNDGLLYLQLVDAAPEPFVCTANNAHTGESQSGYIQLTVEDSERPPSPRVMLAAPKTVTASVEETVVFQCIVGGSPVPDASDIAWSTPGNPRSTLSQNNAILTVRTVTVGDGGVYTCQVNELGNYSATLTVLVAPVLFTSLVSQTPIFGDSLTLTCSVTNTAVSEWRWYHNGSPLTGATSETFLIEASDKSHDGLYQCFAYNSAGNSSSTASISVMTIAASITEPPSPPASLTFEGSDITYSCVAHGAPPPVIVWLHNGRPLTDTTSATNPETRETTSSVRLLNVGMEQSGDYVCRAANTVDGTEVGSVDKQASLTVIATTIITTPSNLQPSFTLNLDKPAVLPCEATAQEGAVLQFAWEKNGSPLVYDDRISLSHGNKSANITIGEVNEEDAGQYVCKVTTYYGGVEGPLVDSIPITVTATEQLIRPILLSFNAITSTSFEVNWYFPGANAQAIASYTVSYKVSGDTDPVAEHTQSISVLTQYLVSDSEETPVKPFTEYIVTVWANYISGEHVASDNVTVVTSEDVPGVPEDVKGTVVNITTVLVEWKEHNGIITNYTLRYKLELSNSLYTTVQMPANTTQYQLSPLLQKASYLVQVAASTAVGLGPFSDPITVSTEEMASTETPIQERVWFIVVVFVVGVVGLMACVIMIVCVLSFARKKRRIYSIQTPAETDKLSGRNARSLTEDDMLDYDGRGSRRNGDLNSVVLALEGQEIESSLGQKYPYEPSISTSVSRMSSQAPSYINPPSFEEALKHMHSRLTPSYSGSTLDRPPPLSNIIESDWAVDCSSKTRILQETLELSPSPARSFQPSPLHISHLAPPPPPISPSHSAHSEHKYASLRGLNHRGQGETGAEKVHSPTPNPAYNGNGYNHLPTPQHTHITTTQTSLSKSQPNFATFV